MPDSVLAWVGQRRAITVSRFQRAWVEAGPARPDSLTPESAARFLDLLIDREVLAERASRRRWHWTAAESAQYLGLRDRLTLKAALDSTLEWVRAARRAAGEPALDLQALGIAARESATSRMDVETDEALIGRLAGVWATLPRPSSDSSLAAQLRVMGAMPQVDPGDTGRALARSTAGPYRVQDLLDARRRTSPVHRPRIDSPAHVRDLVKNGLFERMLRRTAAERRLDRRPDVARQLADWRELVAVTHLIEREVFARAAPDSHALHDYYRRHVNEFEAPARAVVIRLLLPERAAAGRMAARLRDHAEAESLAARAARAGANYRGEITHESEPDLFAAAVRAGVGAVVGPDSLTGGWQVARVSEIRLPRRRSFEEVRELVSSRYEREESESRLRTFVDALRRRTRNVINRRALARLTAS